MKSYSRGYASPARSSRVDLAMPHPMKALSRVAALGSSPIFVLLSPSSDHVSVIWPKAYDIHAAD